MSLREQVDRLIGYIQDGKILEAVEEFYADDVTMQENRQAPTVGKSANLEREKQFLAQVKEWKSTEIHAVGVEGTPDQGAALIEYAFEFVSVENTPVRYEQVSVQRWKGGKVSSERFYYDTGA